MDWLEAIDFQAALENVQRDVRGDWYRDPWDWRELDWLVPDHLEEHAIPRLNASGVKRTAQLDVAKENFAVRPAVVLDPLDRIIYQGLVDCLSARLVEQLPDWAYGWRLPRNKPSAGAYARNDEEWEAFRDHLGRLASYDSAALTTDVVSFFGSIPLEPLCEQILDRVSNEPARRLVDMVRAWYQTTGRGLPQRSAASAVLAHMSLEPLDTIIDHYGAVPPGGIKLVPEGRALRWMDDIWIFGRRTTPLREAQIRLQAGMRDLGLEMNFGKTQVLTGHELLEAVLDIEHSAVDSALNEDDPDVQPLDDLIDHVLEAPETTERTSIHFMTTRMRTHELFDRVPEISEHLERMPHAADHLARLLRDSGAWEGLQDWFVAYARRWHQRLPWAVGQFGTMFPAKAGVERSLIDYVSEVLTTGAAPLPLLTLACQRLSVWDPGEARVLIRDCANRESHPLSRRSLGIAALHAGEANSVVRNLLRQHEENSLILAMLEDTKFDVRAIPTSVDYTG